MYNSFLHISECVCKFWYQCFIDATYMRKCNIQSQIRDIGMLFQCMYKVSLNMDVLCQKYILCCHFQNRLIGLYLNPLRSIATSNRSVQLLVTYVN